MNYRNDFKRSDNAAGSSKSDEPVFLVTGKLRRPHGLKGAMHFDLISDFPERFEPGKIVYAGDKFQQLRIRDIRPHRKSFLISFEGYLDPESVGMFRNTMVYVKADQSPSLPDGEFYHHQLIGMEVTTEEGRNLGILTGILETGANDVLIVRTPSGPDLLLPAID